MPKPQPALPAGPTTAHSTPPTHANPTATPHDQPSTSTHGQPPVKLSQVLTQLTAPTMPAFTATPQHRAPAESYRCSLAMFDTIALSLTIAINITILVKSQRMVLYSQFMRLSPSTLLILATLLQRAWYRWAPDSYFNMRPRILVGNRIIRFCVTMQVPYRSRLWFQDPTTTTQNIAAFINDTRTPTTAASLVHTMILSGALHALISSINLPLPVWPQILSQAAFFTLLTISNALPAAACLATPLLAPATHRLCTTMSDLFVLLVSGFSDSRIDPAARSAVCTDDAPLVVVMFCLLYFAVMVPIYVAYRFEQHMRQCMVGWRQARPVAVAAADAEGWPEVGWWEEMQHGMPYSTSTMVVCDVVLLVLMAGGAWLLAVTLLPVLRPLMVPV